MKSTNPSWSQVKSKLAEFDRPGLVALIKALYIANKDNQVFLHARFSMGDEVLKPYKAAIDRWLWPDVFKNQDISVAKAKKAISDYKRAGAAPGGLAELMVYYCERAAGFSNNVGFQDERYFDALVRMFEQALNTIATLPPTEQESFWERLEGVCSSCEDLGYGVIEEVSDLLADHTNGHYPRRC